MNWQPTLQAEKTLSEARPEDERCFHCQQLLPHFGVIHLQLEGAEHAFCCTGCSAAAEFIAAEDLTDFYRRRQRHSFANKDVKIADARADWNFLNDAQHARDYVVEFANGVRELNVQVSGLYCASCAWLIQQTLQRTAGEFSCSVDVELGAVVVQTSQPQANFVDALQAIEQLGYKPMPVRCDMAGSVGERRAQQRAALKRIAVAGLGMMQVMTFAFGLYLGEFQGIDYEFQRFLTLISMLVATIVVLYSGKPFLDNAIRDLAARRLGMDVPIALAILGAWLPSVYLTLQATNANVYFDSAVMFVFFLSLGRYIESRARYSLASRADRLIDLLPPLVPVLRNDQAVFIHPQEIVVGDSMKLDNLQRAAVDLQVNKGVAQVDESMLTGEPRWLQKSVGDTIQAGSIVRQGCVEVEAISTWADSSIAVITGLLRKAHSSLKSSPSFDRVTHTFVLFVLALTASVCVVWYFVDADRVFHIALAMLVASCPCAFALAAPIATAAASHALRDRGLLLLNPEMLDRVAAVKCWIFDKTGTLTRGRPQIADLQTFDNVDQAQALLLAASLEQGDEHVLRQAFAVSSPLLKAERKRSIAGAGIAAIIEGVEYFIGRPAWVAEQAQIAPTTSAGIGLSSASYIDLARSGVLLARFSITDELRPDCQPALDKLANNTKLLILSGDRQAAVDGVLKLLPMVDRGVGDLRPSEKVDYLVRLRQSVGTTAVVGDGINDAPVLAAADVALAMSNGSELSQAKADVIVLNGRLDSIPWLAEIGRKTHKVVAQNMRWALAYNGVALPLAASGYLTPWLAALGMSVSSLLVVLNALRIKRSKRGTSLELK